ncbi:RNA 2'-phosphotransferase [Bacillus luti]|nr:RNA 2'-phosphotransferase [Bacillus cereus]HDR8329631.1 RNA 2'-phosphotransferase [Bacillus cereus]HDR8336321.1 RNA 2'-phosphotransferase [Bacillus cereus]
MLSKRDEQKLGGFLCLLLRHNPDSFALKIDKYGFASINDLLNIFSKDEYWRDKVSFETLIETCSRDTKERYILTETHIRARYGHSIHIEHPKSDKQLPNILYHGTNAAALVGILAKGILPMNREAVHLSETTTFATLAAKRRKDPILLKIDVAKALALETKFQFAGNEVWLSTPIPVDAIIEQSNIE